MVSPAERWVCVAVHPAATNAHTLSSMTAERKVTVFIKFSTALVMLSFELSVAGLGLAHILLRLGFLLGRLISCVCVFLALFLLGAAQGLAFLLRHFVIA